MRATTVTFTVRQDRVGSPIASTRRDRAAAGFAFALPTADKLHVSFTAGSRGMWNSEIPEQILILGSSVSVRDAKILNAVEIGVDDDNVASSYRDAGAPFATKVRRHVLILGLSVSVRNPEVLYTVQVRIDDED